MERKTRPMGSLLKVRDPIATPLGCAHPLPSRIANLLYIAAPPPTKKQKTAPASSKEAPKEAADAEDEEDKEEEAVPEGDGEEDDEDPEGEAEETKGDEATAAKSGPTASAKATHKDTVPKEDDLAEVKGDD